MNSDAILQQWEKSNQVTVTDSSLKRAALESAVRVCGLSPARLPIKHLRILVASLRRHKLPREERAVTDELVTKHRAQISGVYNHQMLISMSVHTRTYPYTCIF